MYMFIAFSNKPTNSCIETVCILIITFDLYYNIFTFIRYNLDSKSDFQAISDSN